MEVLNTARFKDHFHRRVFHIHLTFHYLTRINCLAVAIGFIYVWYIAPRSAVSKPAAAYFAEVG